MLTFDDCIALSELTAEEIDAIAEDKHLPTIIAAELGCYLLHLPRGEMRIQTILRDNLAQARAAGDLARTARLELVLRHFVQHHRPTCARRRRFYPNASAVRINDPIDPIESSGRIA